MISPNHLNETDRLAEVAREYKDVDVMAFVVLLRYAYHLLDP